MLRIAVPNKGMLSEPAWNMLSEAGYRLRSNPRQLVVEDPDNDIELFYLRPIDIAVYVGRGTVDVGVTGRDLLLNSGTKAVEHLQLGFGASTFRFAAPNDSDISRLEDIDGKRVASSFDKLVDDYLKSNGITADIIHLDGAVESSVHLGVADLIADVVSTGTTLRNAGLRIFGYPILHSEAILIRSPRISTEDERLTVLSRRLQGVLTAQRYVLMDYDIPVEKVALAVGVTPGFESPTVSSLHDKQWAAVRAMVPKQEVNNLMDRLYDIGARAIIVTALQASRM
ncbi:ATP phosphoribosyltransferase [Bifidobacterium crudilactis]|jgi:ATP phosphoribosyltransferase|uniref:ATP phosphoribosyltransferase n=1 Tax=Bifidobacterium crudilactis TaxID=327277 RepID=A0A971ICL5_9BIFI|nr:ATP phosphoribosyltransferase [Bifidobacterium crudilactis]MCI1867884.1 ATP phosphoribosyltransferase [Bifidobacterium crudilactis]MDN5972944.1 ATP phosphoribosyltransferase [Bifidobacterium crudilactis]MDN6001323.1 ATP phosphoribosyltransferase [Bifidobacterium crudilactis]MDN6209236.1 ATP phosphoribosyltransferase [Bifidobacterium crudilactis]MDN6234481.1 ATP phosphoribosyltransferase [Bifidobacterium crudilactis]